ncbi:hypothetical protein MJN76_33915, partial [Salmonella enterica subsp. enterica serovar Anatum]|nr:hypothetical protein [Salmonella enterica subsp. enterica serovar Anatum]
DMPVVQYDFSRLQAQSNGLFSEADLNRELKKQQRITPHIISQMLFHHYTFYIISRIKKEWLQIFSVLAVAAFQLNSGAMIEFY